MAVELDEISLPVPAEVKIEFSLAKFCLHDKPWKRWRSAEMSWLDVPHLQQTEPGWCLPACVAMAVSGGDLSRFVI